MPADYFMQVFSDNPGFVAQSKNKELILNGVNVVLRTLRFLKNDYEITRRISILSSLIKYSSDLVDTALIEIDQFIDELSPERKSSSYAAVASGLANYKEFQYALKYFQKAVEYIQHVSDSEERSIRKGHSYVIANMLGVSMLYDLETSSQTSQNLWACL